MTASPATVPVSGASPSAAVTRADIVAMGRGRQPDGEWTFIPLAESAINAHPDDHEVRFLLAGSYARLGLRTPALEHLGAFPQSLRDQDPVRAMEAAVAALPDDRVSPAELLARARDNLVALAERGVHLQSEFEAWRAALAARVFHRTGSAQVPECLVRARTAMGAEWLNWGPHHGVADKLNRELSAAVSTSAPPRPMVVEGVCPPWTLLAIVRALPPRADGSRAGIRVLQSDPLEFFDGLAMADLRPLILDERSAFFVGADAHERLACWLDARDTTLLDGLTIVSPGVRRRCPVSPAAILSGALHRQVAQLNASAERVAGRTRPRDRAWWSKRYSEAWPRGAPGAVDHPLRVLVPTYRMSTYVRHAAADLCAALESLGVSARLLMEPDEASALSRLAYIRAIEEFDPDLIVSLNYTRAGLNASAASQFPAIDPGIPFVTWIQDAMPHLFRSASGTGMGELDFAMGHAHLELFTEFNYPAQRFLPFAMCVSESKFHDGPVEPALRRQFECEIAFVTHHAETPEQMRDRLVVEAGQTPALQAIVQAAFPIAFDMADHPLERVGLQPIREAAKGLLESARINATPEQRAVVSNQVLRPLLDRILRHRAAHWAADLCERRGWRFHLYGRGWERHPTLARFARGPLDHGEELRAAYQCALINLHVCVALNLHQRVMECALSGGLPIALFKNDDLRSLEAAASLAVTREATPWCCETSGARRTFVHPADHPASAQFLALQQRLGVPARHEADYDPRFVNAIAEQGALAGLDWQDAWLLGDPVATCFWDRDSFEQRITAAVESPSLRDNARAGICKRVRRSFTLQSIAQRMLALVRDGLDSGAGSAAASSTIR